MRASAKVAELTREDLEKCVGKAVLLLPVGATEQHGPHLPVGTDTFIAEAVCELVAMKVADALILPSLPYTYSWVWRDIPVSPTLSVGLFEALVKELLVSLDRFGPKGIVVVNGHLANANPLKYAVREASDSVRSKILFFSYPGLERFQTESERSSLTVHAEEIETSIMLAVRPDLVKMEKAVREYPMKPQSYDRSALSLGSLSISGVFGDATVANAKKGEEYLKIMVDEIVATMVAEGLT